MTGIDPAIEPPVERTRHPVGIVKSERAEQRFATIGGSGTGGVAEPLDAGNAVGENFRIHERKHANGDVQPRSKLRDLVGHAIAVGIGDDPDCVAGLPLAGRKWVLDRLGHEQPTGGVEREIHRLLNLGLTGHQFDVEPGRELEQLLLFGW